MDKPISYRQSGHRAQSCFLDQGAGGHFFAARGSDALDGKVAAQGGNGNAVFIHGGHFTGHAVRCAGELAGVVELHLAAGERAPGAGLRVGAADEVPHRVEGLTPVDFHLFLAAPAFVGGVGLVLRDFRRRTVAHLVHCLQHRFHAQGVKLVEIQASQGVGVRDIHLLLQQDRPRVQPVVRPENRQARLLLAPDDRPVDRARPAVARQQ